METAAVQTPAHNDAHLDIQPKILYFGTPVVLVSTCNEDESPNLAAMSSAWALGWTVVLGLGYAGKTSALSRWKRDFGRHMPSTKTMMTMG